MLIERRKGTAKEREIARKGTKERFRGLSRNFVVFENARASLRSVMIPSRPEVAIDLCGLIGLFVKIRVDLCSFVFGFSFQHEWGREWARMDTNDGAWVGLY